MDMIFYISLYTDGRNAIKFRTEILDKQTISDAFKEIEYRGHLVCKLAVNSNVYKELSLICKDIFRNDHIWTAEVIIDNTLANNEMFLYSNEE